MAKARQYLEELRLTPASVLESRLEAAREKEVPYAEFLVDLLGIEARARRERYLTTRTRLAHLPFRKTLEDFDFQPSIDERQVRELATVAFVADAANVVLLGPPGVGKTHLAVALGLRAIEHGYGVYFVRAHDLLEDLRRAESEHWLDRRMRVYLSAEGADHRRVRGMAVRPGWCHRLVRLDLDAVRAGEHHSDLEQGVRRLG